MKISNQKPAILSPVYDDPIGNQFDPTEFVKKTITDPIFTPMVQGHPVSITSNGKTVTQDEVTQTFIDCMGEAYNAVADNTAKTILGQTLTHFDANTNLTTDELFPLQSGTAAHLPEPNANVVYTPSQDVIPTARKFLSGICDYDTFFASLAYYARPEILGFYFANEVAFEDFKAWMSTQMSMLGSVMPNETNTLCADFQKLTLKELTESIMLRNDDSENNDPNTFARLIISLLMRYTNVVSQAEFGVLPFTLSELYCPKNIIFVNVELHGKASAKQIADEWNLVKTSLQNKPAMVSNRKLSRLTATQRNMQRIANAAVNASRNQNRNAMKAANVRFRKTAPNTIDIARIIKRIMEKMEFVNRSQNIYKSVKTTYAKPNRRDPDDFNKTGKTISIQYKPDLHIYIDTSGSISEQNFQETMKACIAMAKKLNINLYFNSFSHVLSQTTKLNLENKSKVQIYNEFRKVPKVTGGTDFEQIWHFINQSKKRKRELSIIITDFAYDPPTRFVKHPKNLYYIPCSRMDWDKIIYWAKNFVKGMMHNDPDIRKRILF